LIACFFMFQITNLSKDWIGQLILVITWANKYF